MFNLVGPISVTQTSILAVQYENFISCHFSPLGTCKIFWGCPTGNSTIRSLVPPPPPKKKQVCGGGGQTPSSGVGEFMYTLCTSIIKIALHSRTLQIVFSFIKFNYFT